MIACVRFPSKNRYLSKADAKTAIRRIKGAHHRDEIRPYRCEHCGEWHVGHAPEKRRLREAPA